MGPNVSTICETHCVQNIAYFSSFTYACAFIFNKDTSLVHFFHFNSHFKEFLYFETWNKKGTPKHIGLFGDRSRSPANIHDQTHSNNNKKLEAIPYYCRGLYPFSCELFFSQEFQISLCFLNFPGIYLRRRQAGIEYSSEN